MAPSVFEKYRIVLLASEGLSMGQIAEVMGIAKSAVTYVVSKWRRTGLIERRAPGAGRHRISTVAEDEALLENVRNSPFTTAVCARNVTGFPGSIRTTRRRIKIGGLNNHVAANKTALTPRHMEARISFALEHLPKDEAYWSRLVFSDEKVFQSSHNGRIRVYRPRNSRFDQQYVQNTHRSGRFSINLWAWISVGSPGVMVHVEERLNSDVYSRILENIMVPSVQMAYPNNNFIFQQDNCSIHTAHRVTEWFENHNINVLDWPSRSPDLNPIENMWGLMVKKLQGSRLIFANREEFLNAITDAWQSLPQDYYRNLCLFMPSRLRKILEVNGAMTKY
jgi:DNA-binding MarR family transcriptional regulator